MNQPQTDRGSSFFMLDGWEVPSYATISSHHVASGEKLEPKACEKYTWEDFDCVFFGLIFQHSMALEQAFSSGRRMEPNLALESSPHQDNHEVNFNLNLQLHLSSTLSSHWFNHIFNPHRHWSNAHLPNTGLPSIINLLFLYYRVARPERLNYGLSQHWMNEWFIS
jgi:hypothetical protein